MNAFLSRVSRLAMLFGLLVAAPLLLSAEADPWKGGLEDVASKIDSVDVLASNVQYQPKPHRIQIEGSCKDAVKIQAMFAILLSQKCIADQVPQEGGAASAAYIFLKCCKGGTQVMTLTLVGRKIVMTGKGTSFTCETGNGFSKLWDWCNSLPR